jgi:tetratricopeptide (TPR) repeat protein
MSLDVFLQTAWADHADHAQEVADRLAASMHLVQAPADVHPFAALLAHVYGEHLGQWRPGIALLEQVRRAPGYDGSAAAEEPLVRWIATLRYAGGEAGALPALSTEDRVAVLANASAMFAGRQEFRGAIDAYGQALRLAQAGLPAGSPAIRALAIGGNNLAAVLEGKATLDAAERAGMLAAAQGGLTYWKQAGTWLEEERAEYRLSRSLQKAGEAEAAVRAAQRCVEVCRRNEAPAFEMFFGHAVLALAHRLAGDREAFAAQRDLALTAFTRLPEDQKKSCEAGRAELLA